jgi:Arc/MetJ-type ribon-helix-helix transcriptional regulator
MTQAVIRKTFTLTQKDIQVIRQAVKNCGYVSDSEALRAIIKFYYENAPCMATQDIREQKEST